MGMLGIACGIFTMADIHNTRTVTLSVDGLHETLALLSIDIRNKSLTRLEVICYLVWLVFICPLLEQRLSLNGTS